MKQSHRWHSPRLGQEILFCRWGHFGRPVLVFPTAGGDAEEIERMLMIKALTPLLEQGRIKVYSVDSVPPRHWSDTSVPGDVKARMQNAYDDFIAREVFPAIRRDCGDDSIEITTAGSSIGAFNAMATLCRHPEEVAQAICMSGTYDVHRFMKGLQLPNKDYHFASPMNFLPYLQGGAQLEKLQQRHAIMCHGGGRWEDPEQDWKMAAVLGTKGIPNRVDPWGEGYDHDWPSWRAMLPKYLAEL